MSNANRYCFAYTAAALILIKIPLSTCLLCEDHEVVQVNPILKKTCDGEYKKTKDPFV